MTEPPLTPEETTRLNAINKGHEQPDRARAEFAKLNPQARAALLNSLEADRAAREADRNKHK